MALNSVLTHLFDGVEAREKHIHDDRIDELVERLSNWPGVRKAERLGSAEIADLLEPWLGEAGAYDGLPLPALIAVEFSPGTAIDLEALAAELGDVAPGVLVDDHQRWLGDMLARFSGLGSRM